MLLPLRLSLVAGLITIPVARVYPLLFTARSTVECVAECEAESVTRQRSFLQCLTHCRERSFLQCFKHCRQRSFLKVAPETYTMRLTLGTAFLVFLSMLLLASLPILLSLRAKYLHKIDAVSNYPSNALEAYCKNCTYTPSQAPGCKTP